MTSGDEKPGATRTARCAAAVITLVDRMRNRLVAFKASNEHGDRVVRAISGRLIRDPIRRMRDRTRIVLAAMRIAVTRSWRSKK
jgi:hypothetical protein